MESQVWRAMYYPYADFRTPSFALQAALYYDELYFLQTGIFCPPWAGGWRAYLRESKALMSADVALLYEAGLLREVDGDFLGIRHHWIPGLGSQVDDDDNRKILVDNLRADFGNQQLLELTRSSGKLSWFFPNAQFIGIAASGVLYEAARAASSDIGLEYAAPGHTAGPGYLGREYSSVVRFTSSDTAERRTPDHFDMESVSVPFHVGESLMINVALLAASRISATPVTDNPIHHKFLRAKLSGMTIGDEAHSWLREHGFARKAKAEGLAREVIKLRLPDIQPLTGQRVLDIRRRCSDELRRFRSEMLRLATKMEANFWDPDFAREVSNLIALDVTPALTMLEASLKKLQRDLGVRVIEKTVSASPLALVTTLFAGLPIPIALAAAAGVGALTQTYDYWSQRKLIRTNGLSFLLSL